MGCTLTREELYKMVWSKPLSTLALEVGVSDTALGKACKRASIPRPGQGYWAKKKAGKSVHQLPLGLRFPGASNTISIGDGGFSNSSAVLLNNPLPPPPHFCEDISDLRLRVEKLVGKVEYPAITNKTHSIISKFLEQDEERRKDYIKYKFRWGGPLFDSSIQKRRLRILNAIFLAARKLGCQVNMPTSQYEQKNRDATIYVGDQGVCFTLTEIVTKYRGKNSSKPAKEKLRLIIKGDRDSPERYSFEDTDELKIEKLLNNVVVEIVMSGEIQFREILQWHYQWDVDQKARLEKEDRLRIIEEKRLALEFRAKKENECIDNLIEQATVLQKAETIRNFVNSILKNIRNIDASASDIDKWASWALLQADRIDPVKNPSFLYFDDDIAGENE